MDVLEIFLLKCLLLICPVLSGPLQSRFIRQTQISDDEMLLREICQIGDGEFRHPYYCGKYLQCGGGAFTEKDCPSMMVYDVKIHACNFRRLITCRVVGGLTDYGDSVTYVPPPGSEEAIQSESAEAAAVATPEGPMEGHLIQLESEPSPVTAIVATEATTAATLAPTSRAVKKASKQPIALAQQVMVVQQNIPATKATQRRVTVPVPVTTETDRLNFMQPEKTEEDCVIWEDDEQKL